MSKISCQQLQTQLEALTKLVTDSVAELKQATQDSKDILMEKLDNLGIRLDAVDNRLDEIDNYLTSNDERLTKIENDTDANSLEIASLKERIESLETENRSLTSLTGTVKSLEEKVEERTNRQLRETLVIRNVPELTQNESFSQTKELLAKVISDNVDDISFDYALSQIKRAHRETFRNDSYRKGKRLIYACFFSWDICEKIKDSFRSKCISDKDFIIQVDQKYGPLTTSRRRMALQKRKELKDSGVITSGYIDFPAKLMVNFTGELNNDGKKVYKQFANFSKVDVLIDNN